MRSSGVVFYKKIKVQHKNKDNECSLHKRMKCRIQTMKKFMRSLTYLT